MYWKKERTLKLTTYYLLRKYFRFIQVIINFIYYNTNAVEISKSKGIYYSRKHYESLHVFCIVFNNLNILSYTAAFYSKSMNKKIIIYFVDNSNISNNFSNEVKNICNQYGFNYLKLPSNPYSSNYPMGKALDFFYKSCVKKEYVGSCSHGVAINWICRNIVIRKKIRYFGFTDYDLIPLKGVKILNKLYNQPFYGRKISVNNIFYLWPGYCFFDSSKISPKKLNFLPSNLGDTGSYNYLIIFKKFEKENFSNAKYKVIKLTEGADFQSNCIELIDDWLHVINASNWKNVKMDEKEEKIIQIIEPLLK